MSINPTPASRIVRLARIGLKRSTTEFDDTQLTSALKSATTWKRATLMVDRMARSAQDSSSLSSRRSFWAVAWCDDATALATFMVGEFSEPEIRTRVREALLVRSADISRTATSAFSLRKAALSSALDALKLHRTNGMFSPAWEAFVTVALDPDFDSVLQRFAGESQDSITVALDVRRRALDINAYALLVGLCKSSPASRPELWQLTVALNTAALNTAA